jgi:ribosome biogenesis protein SLX9
MKRKAKEQLAGNTMDDLQIALASLDKDIVPPESMDKPPLSVPIHSNEVKPKAISRIGKIGKGNSSTLSKAQRKRML